MSKEFSWPEPSPGLTTGRFQYWSWILYKYGFGILFALNSLWALYVLSKGRGQSLEKPHALVMNMLLLAMGCLRAAVLFWDPLLFPPESPGLFVFQVILFGLGSAFGISAFTILLLLLLETSNITSAGQPRFRLRYTLSLTCLYVVLFVAADLVVMAIPRAKIILFICQALYAIWGLSVCGGFAVTAFKIWHNLKSSRNLALYHNQYNRENKQIRTLVSLMLLASLTGGISFVLKIYAATGDYGVFGAAQLVEYWPWFGLTASTRMTELIMNILVYSIALRNRGNRTKRSRVGMTMVDA